MKCPNCNSSDVESNKICHKGSGGHAVHGSSHAAMAGHPLGAVIIGGLYGVGKVIDHFTEHYRCRSCGHKFS